MPVESTSVEYDLMLPLQEKCRDCIEGEHRLHELGTKYLPGLSGQSTDREITDAYQSYKQRAFYYNTVGRSKEFFRGLILRVAPSIEYPSQMEDLVDDLTGQGINFFNFCSYVVDEIISVGWGGILVDYDDVPEDVVTRAEAQKYGYRSKLKFYPAESIINTDRNIRLLEEKEVWIDEFTKITQQQIKVLDLDEDGFYRQRVFVMNEKGEYFLDSVYYPSMADGYLRYIPFFPCGSDSNSFKISKPPLLDLAEASLHHYNVYADYRNGVHFTGFPQLYVTGHKSSGSKLRMGSGVAWELEEPNATVKYAEFSGSGLAYPEKLLDRLENIMSKLGARMLMVEKRAAESADKVKHDSAAESSVLAHIALNCADAISRSLNVMKDFEGVDGDDIKVELNTDYQVSEMNPATIVALMKGVQAGWVSHQTFLYNLKKGELFEPNVTVEEEIKRLEKEREKLDAMNEQLDLKSFNPLSERNPLGFKDPKDDIRDTVREKTDYGLEG